MDSIAQLLLPSLYIDDNFARIVRAELYKLERVQRTGWKVQGAHWHA